MSVEVAADVVKSLQQGHGGWSEGMVEVNGPVIHGGYLQSLLAYSFLCNQVLAAVGVVRGIDEDHDVVVEYPSRNRWAAVGLSLLNSPLLVMFLVASWSVAGRLPVFLVATALLVHPG